MVLDELPELGSGTFSNEENVDWTKIVAEALDIGYRHIDTAEVYGTEEAVGEGLARADIDREDVFLATKVIHYDVPGPEYDDVINAVEGCLDRLGVDYLDLLYVHWPTGIYDAEEMLPAFDDLRDDGVTRHIGVSNFRADQIDEAREILDAPIEAHQVEMNPYCQQEELLEYAKEHDHWLIGYSPLARGEVFEDSVLIDIADKHDTSISQVTLAWLLSRENVGAVPRTSSVTHLRDNFESQNLELDDEDIDRIDSIDREFRVVDPDWAPWNEPGATD